MRRLIQWFVDNPIAANLLMVAMLVGGYIGAGNVKKEVFPSNELRFVNVDMSFPGAAPSEVEQQVVIRIEEAVSDIPGIFQITSESQQSHGSVRIEVIEGFDVKQVLNDVKSRVDAINTFPGTVERPIIRHQVNRQRLMFFSMYGDADPAKLKEIAYQIQDEMAVLEGISMVTVTGTKSDEVSIEISEQNLRRYNLTFDQIAAAIRQSSISLPAGTIKTGQGDIQVQTRAQAFDEADFAKIVVRSNPDGSQLLLEDIAIIRDGFAEEDIEFSYNGKPGLDFQVVMSDDPDLFAGTKNAREYIEQAQEFLPEGVELHINYEMRELFDSRFNLLKDNAIGGLTLVFIVLMLFLRPALAVWVVLGIVTTFAGAIWILPYFGISFNMLSMFGFLMVLGIVVDDAIIVGESIYTHQQNGMKGTAASALGAKMVFKPVFLAVTTTIIFFTPMIGVPVAVAPFTHSIFFVVLLCLIFSLVESVFILPSHLSHMKPEKESRFAAFRQLKRVRDVFSGQMERFALHIYQPALRKLLENKVSTFAGFFVAFGLSVAVLSGGWINVSFFPNVPQSFIIANVNYPDGSPFREAQETANHITEVAGRLRTDKDLLAANGGKPFITEVKKTANGNNANVFVGLMANEDRIVSAQDITTKLKDMIGPIPEAQNYSLNFTFGGQGPDIQLNLNLLANDRGSQQAAVDSISAVLDAYPGVSNVKSDLESERVEVELGIKEHAETLGINLNQIATQVRQGFYGEEIQRIPRSKEDVRVMLRYPEKDRSSIDTLSNMRVRTDGNTEIPLDVVAQVDMVPGFTSIRRVDRKRNITITADVEEGYDANQIVNEMLENYTADWKREFVGLNLSRDGNLRTQGQFQTKMLTDFLKGLVVVLALLAIAFRSIIKPFLVILAVPFGFMGAMFGHVILGHDLSMMSSFGFLACAGVVVNDNLVLLDRVSQLRQQGVSVFESVLNAGVDRFRPIVLTSLTTFVGLMPILFERSGQAQFLIPMVISLSFGVMLSSTVTLFLVPSAYLMGSRAKERLKVFFGWGIQKVIAADELNNNNSNDDEESLDNNTGESNATAS